MNKGISLLLLGVIACAMGIVLFLQMEQRNSGGVLSGQDSFLSSVEHATDAIASSTTSKPTENATLSPTKKLTPLTTEGEVTEKKLTEPEKTPAQPKLIAPEKTPMQESTPAQQKNDVQEKTPLEQKSTTQVNISVQKNATQAVTLKTTNASVSSDKKKTEPQTKTSSIKKMEPSNTKTTPAPVAKTDTSSGIKGTHEMSSLAVQFSGSSVHVIIKANNSFAYKTMLLSSPDRLVIDLPGIWKKMATATTPKNRLLEKIRIGNQPLGPRMVLDLKVKPKKYDIYKIDKTTLEIVIE